MLNETSNGASDLTSDGDSWSDVGRSWEAAARDLVVHAKAYFREEFAHKLLRAAPPNFRQAAGRLFGIPIPRYLLASEHLFIHIPKNAGVSISQAIYGRQVWHRTASFFRDSDPDFFSGRLSFAVVRNPWDRLISAFEYHRAGGTALSRVSHRTAPPRASLRSFETYVLDYVFPNKHQLNTLDDVLWEQHTFVNDQEGKRLVHFLGRFEDLATFERRLLEEKIIRAPLVHLNRSPSRASRDHRHYYTSQDLVDAVAACYGRDITEFSYQF
jgi:hypothetical protein